MTKQTSYRIAGGLCAVVGLFQLFQTVFDRPAGTSMSLFGLSTGVLFVAAGVFFISRGSRQT